MYVFVVVFVGLYKVVGRFEDLSYYVINESVFVLDFIFVEVGFIVFTSRRVCCGERVGG